MIGLPFQFIADLGDLDHCWGLLAPGQSGHQARPHRTDGVKSWFTAGYRPMLFRHDEVEQNLEARGGAGLRLKIWKSRDNHVR